MNPVRTLTTALAAAALTISGLTTTSGPAAADPDTDRGFVECDSYFPSQVPCVRDTRHWSYDANGYAPSLIVRRNNDGVLVSREVTHARAHRLLHGTDPEPRPAVQPAPLLAPGTIQASTDTPTAARGKRCKHVTKYGGYDQFWVGSYRSRSYWRVAPIIYTRACPKAAYVKKVAVEYRNVKRTNGSPRCWAIREFRAYPDGIGGWNPGYADTGCNESDSSRFLTWVPANPVKVGRNFTPEWRCFGGKWEVDIEGGNDYTGGLGPACVSS